MRRPLAFIVFLILLILVLIFFFPDFFYTDLDAIRKIHEKWLAAYATHPVKILSLYMLFNIVVVMLPIPGITIVIFIGGSLFGFVPGVIYSSIATAIGNLGGFFLARTFLRERVMKKYGHRVKVFENDWHKNGAMVLFSLRLIPMMPAFVGNFIMGVSPLNWWTFFWVSWLGKIPMVVVYTYAGVEASSLKHFSDILHPSVFLAFMMLALLPWILKFYLNKREKNEKAYRDRWWWFWRP